jgi:hypothetical protein
MRLDESSLQSAVASLSSPGTGKFKTEKALIALSETEPELLEPLFDELAKLLESDNSIIKWGAFQIMANLACVSREDRVVEILPRYLAPIPGPVMISAGVAIQGAAKIARCHKQHTPRIVQAILQVESGTYKTEECRHIAIGHAITALGTMEAEVKQWPSVLEFVRRQTENPRSGTRKKATLFLKQNEAERPVQQNRRTTGAVGPHRG